MGHSSSIEEERVGDEKSKMNVIASNGKTAQDTPYPEEKTREALAMLDTSPVQPRSYAEVVKGKNTSNIVQ